MNLHASNYRAVHKRPSRSVPFLWLLMGYKAGDNTQVLALAEALDWPFEAKKIVYRPTELLTNLLLGPTLAGVQRNNSSALVPPWPDLVITAGRRNEPVARWVKAHSRGHTRLVHLGRPWADPKHFERLFWDIKCCEIFIGA